MNYTSLSYQGKGLNSNEDRTLEVTLNFPYQQIPRNPNEPHPMATMNPKQTLEVSQVQQLRIPYCEKHIMNSQKYTYFCVQRRPLTNAARV